jgi:hypothetical protein
MISQGHPEPYTITLITFTAISMLAIPMFYMAGKRFERDRQALYDSVVN